MPRAILGIVALLFLGSLFFWSTGGWEEKKSQTSSETPPPVASPQASNQSFEIASVVINGAEFLLEVADSSTERARGLSSRGSLPEQGGMIFLFDPPERPIFWMKDMHFGLDIIWVRDERIVGVTENVPPPTPGTSDFLLERYPAPAEVDTVIEIRAGLFKTLGLDRASGTPVEIRLPSENS